MLNTTCQLTIYSPLLSPPNTHMHKEKGERDDDDSAFELDGDGADEAESGGRGIFFVAYLLRIYFFSSSSSSFVCCHEP